MGPTIGPPRRLIRPRSARRPDMTRAPLVAALALLVLPPFVAARQKDKTPPPATPRPAAATADDLARQAEEKIAAGDLAGASELLRKAAGLPATSAEARVKLGQLFESARDLDTAMESYEAAAATLTGAAKSEALGRLAVLQESRGLSAFAKTAEAAGAADADAAWGAIALARLRAREGKGDEAL